MPLPSTRGNLIGVLATSGLGSAPAVGGIENASETTRQAMFSQGIMVRLPPDPPSRVARGFLSAMIALLQALRNETVAAWIRTNPCSGQREKRLGAA
jgi:hypothetical protein